MVLEIKTTSQQLAPVVVEAKEIQEIQIMKKLSGVKGLEKAV